MDKLRSFLSKSPAVRFMRQAEANTREQKEHVEQQRLITTLHAMRANHYFYELNHVTPHITNLVMGKDLK